MAKDPAFLFYSSDFLTGTLFMTDSQIGKYIKLMCLQHQKGHLTESEMKRVCGENKDDQDIIFEKFSTDKFGKYFNKRLEEEIEKRKKHSKRQKENALKRWNKSGSADMQEESRDDAEVMPNGCHGIADAMPLENENENENKNKDINTNTNKDIFIDHNFSKKAKEVITDWLSYKKEKRQPYKPTGLKNLLTQINNKISEFGEDAAMKAITESMASNYTGIIWDKGCNIRGKPEEKATPRYKEFEREPDSRKDAAPMPPEIRAMINKTFKTLEVNHED